MTLKEYYGLNPYFNGIYFLIRNGCGAAVFCVES